jgi:mannan endo-1,4-beta-mannosidase
MLHEQAVHAWPDNWQVDDPAFMTSWVNCHIQASASIGKPMILEEVLILPLVNFSERN